MLTLLIQINFSGSTGKHASRTNAYLQNKIQNKTKIPVTMK